MNAAITENCKAYIKSINKIKTTKNTKAKRLSGYNVFCMESRKKMEGPPTEIMIQLGAMWKKCTDSKKESYKKKAEKLNISAAKEAQENLVDEDFQTTQLESEIRELIKNFKKSILKKANTTEDE
jgi:hypothetical protein